MRKPVLEARSFSTPSMLSWRMRLPHPVRPGQDVIVDIHHIGPPHAEEAETTVSMTFLPKGALQARYKVDDVLSLHEGSHEVHVEHSLQEGSFMFTEHVPGRPLFAQGLQRELAPSDPLVAEFRRVMLVVLNEKAVVFRAAEEEERKKWSILRSALARIYGAGRK